MASKTQSFISQAELAGIYLGHLKAAESDAIAARLRAIRADAAGNTDAAAQERATAEAAEKAAAQIRAEIPADLADIMSAVVKQQEAEAAAQRATAARLLSDTE